MGKFNKPGVRSVPRSARASGPMGSALSADAPPVKCPGVPHAGHASSDWSCPLEGYEAPDTVTHEGAAAYSHEARTALYLMAAAGFVAEDSFYEKAPDKLMRLRALVHQIAVEEGGREWLQGFLPYLRHTGNMRTAPLVMVAEAIRAYDEADEPSALRSTVASVLHRMDEPVEALAYWNTRYGAPIPNALRRGIADALEARLDEYSFLKYDSGYGALRLGNVIEVCRPEPSGEHQAALFKHAIEAAHGWKDVEPQPLLEMVNFRKNLELSDPSTRRAYLRKVAQQGGVEALLRRAGATWEWLSGWLSDGQGMTAEAWEWIIPSMGYMALIRNLRNFDEKGIDQGLRQMIAEKIADPDEVAKSRQFPYRFWSAYDAAPSDFWKHALQVALDKATGNIPALPGKSLVMVDTSASMRAHVSDKSTRTLVESGALFGLSLAYRNPDSVELYGFADYEFRHQITLGGAVLPEMVKFARKIGKAGHGTNIVASTNAAFNAHPGGFDRVFIISDMQSMDSMGGVRGRGYPYGRQGWAVPDTVPVYAFDLGSYAQSFIATGVTNRFQLGGLTDATFRMVPMIEAGQQVGWPWEE